MYSRKGLLGVFDCLVYYWYSILRWFLMIFPFELNIKLTSHVIVLSAADSQCLGPCPQGWNLTSWGRILTCAITWSIGALANLHDCIEIQAVTLLHVLVLSRLVQMCKWWWTALCHVHTSVFFFSSQIKIKPSWWCMTVFYFINYDTMALDFIWGFWFYSSPILL